MSLKDKKILLMISGSIAAYKSCEIVRLLLEQGASVRVVMSSDAKQFITPLTLQALSGAPVRCDLFDQAAESNIGATMDHISLARWCDAILLAPASANRIARLASGQSDDLIGALCLATRAPLWFAPAMNTMMWQHPTTVENVKRLAYLGWNCIPPTEGTLACGEFGAGKMSEPQSCVAALAEHFSYNKIEGVKVVITAGPTHQPIDETRFLSNRSSGKMGYALASCAAQMAAKVTLISGPTALTPPPSVSLVAVETAEEMYQASLDSLNQCAIFIGSAAVADYTPKTVAKGKLSKQTHGSGLRLELTQTKDIVSEVADHAPACFVVGFCAQTSDLEKEAKRKLIQKKMSMVVANWVGSSAADNCGFGGDNNQAVAYWQGGSRQFSKQPKIKLARKILELVHELRHVA